MRTFTRLHLVLLSLSLLLASRAQAAPAPCRVEKAEYRGWTTYRLSNGLVTLYVAPEIGGRVIQYELGDHPFFFVNSELAGKVFPPEENGGEKGGWKNYGGDKLWPAPQGWENDNQWPGPPDPVLDGGRYQGEITSNDPAHVAVTVTSPADVRTGVQFRRTIHLFPGGTQVRLESVMKNISPRPVRWSIWEVTQLDTADPKNLGKWNDDFWAFCPLNPRSVHPKGFYPMFGQVNHPSYRADYDRGMLAVKFDYRVGKVGLDSNAGWLAAINGASDHCFVSQFTHYPGLPYPDNASVEFWLNGAGEFILNGLAITNAANPRETPYLMEAEILSPLAQLRSGEEYAFQTQWAATRCPKPIVEVTAAGVVNRPLTLARRGARVRLEGVFGVFCPGHVEAVCVTADGKILERQDLGAVEPGRVFRLDRELSLPETTFRISVRLIDEAGANRGVLGNAAVPLPTAE